VTDETLASVIPLREHRQGDVGVPGATGADLVMVEPGFVLGLLECLFDTPAGSGDRSEGSVARWSGVCRGGMTGADNVFVVCDSGGDRSQDQRGYRDGEHHGSVGDAFEVALA
jgi:hypothetical protein